MDAIIDDMTPIKAALIMEVTFKLVINVLNDWFEARYVRSLVSIIKITQICSNRHKNPCYQSQQLMASPYPGVSTTVSLSFTPLSSISTVLASILTVCLTFSAAGGISLSG